MTDPFLAWLTCGVVASLILLFNERDAIVYGREFGDAVMLALIVILFLFAGPVGLLLIMLATCIQVIGKVVRFLNGER